MDNQTSADMRTQMVFQASKKSTGAAYLLWFFLGGFGAHRFYLGQTGTAIAQLLLGLLGWLPLFVGWIILGIWLLVDAFLIPGIIQEQNLKLVNTLTGSLDRPRSTSTARFVD
jgi:TM2 domain-containing membrane protein YozV